MFKLAYKVEEKSDFEKATTDENYAISLYKTERNKFNSLRLEERAYLIEKWFSLLKEILQNPSISDEDLAALTTVFPQEKVATFNYTSLSWYPAISRKLNTERQEIADWLSRLPAIVAKLDRETLVSYSRINPDLAFNLFDCQQADKLNSQDISSLAARSATKEGIIDDYICFLVLLEKKFLDKLNAASKLLVFSRVQQIAPQYPQSFAALSADLQTQINRSYPLPLDRTLLYWIAALAGLGDSCWITRFQEVLGNAKGTWWQDQMYSGLQRAATPLETLSAEALAWILIQEKGFITGWSNQYVPGHFLAQVTTEDRINLGLLYPKIAYELLTNTKCQGTRKFTDDEVRLLVAKHDQQGDVDPADFMRNWFRAKHNKLKNIATTPDRTECVLYEQHQNYVKGRAVDFNNIPSLKTFAAHAFLKTKQHISSPQELSEFTENMDRFEKKF